LAELKPPRAVSKPPPPPRKLIGGKYELVSIAGRGGMATVWRSVLRGPGGFVRTVAVKQMHPHLADKSIYVEMFCEEARVGAELGDPNIAQVYDFVAEGGQYYLVMEWIDGIDLGTFVRHFTERNAQTNWEIVTAVGIGMLRGLAAAHERPGVDGDAAPILHRDISPHNILLSIQGPAKLIDFGLSLAHDRDKDLTEPGVVKGKMSYLAPELVKGSRPTTYTDQFAAGCVLWEALVGRKLFDGATDFEVYSKMRNGQVQPLRPLRPDIPRELVAVVTRALAVNEKRRYPSVREMARQLGVVLKSARPREDLHATLSRTVIEAQANPPGGGRSDPSMSTPVVDIGTDGSGGLEQQRRGLRHRLPFLRGRSKSKGR
jgi:serine/threonine-protein kinase